MFLADIYTVQLFYRNETTHGESLVGLATEALQIRERAVESGLMDEFHPNRANGFMNVAVVLAHENPQKAIDLHKIALGIRLGSNAYSQEQVHGIALNYLNIGRCWLMVKNLEEAGICFQKCLLLMLSRESKVGKRFPLYGLHF